MAVYPSLKTGFLQLLTGSALGRGLTFILNIFLSRVLGPQLLGIFTLVLSTSQTFEISSRGGIDYGLQCALTSKSKKSKVFETGVVIKAYRLLFIFVITLAVLLFIWLVPLNGLVPNEYYLNRGLIVIGILVISAIEGLGGMPWDLLLLKGKTKLVAARQAIFIPLKILASLVGSIILGILGALIGYATIGVIQLVWLRTKINKEFDLETNEKIPEINSWELIKPGLPLYTTNLLSAFIFLPLIGSVASNAGIGDIGYLRVGQILVQLFTLVPASLAPLLFVKSRLSFSTNKDQTSLNERSLLSVWILGLFTFFLYRLVDVQIVSFAFGNDFLGSIQPTRILILSAILESLGQILHIRILAEERTKLFFLAQNSAAVFAAVIGFISIPVIGLAGFLASKFVFSCVPFLIYIYDSWNYYSQKRTIKKLCLGYIVAALLCLTTGIAAQLTFQLTLLLVILLTSYEFKHYLMVGPR